ncbi:hypothetical protein JCM11641_007790 [Rhodosporidiobolus odoratus]
MASEGGPGAVLLTAEGGEHILSRTVLAADELETLKKEFEQIDPDHGGKMDPIDLTKTMTKLGLEADESTVSNIISEVDSNADGSINLEEYLDIAAGVKELHLNNATVDLTLGKDGKNLAFEAGDEGKGRAGGNEAPTKNGQKVDYKSNTPPERTGRGW